MSWGGTRHELRGRRLVQPSAEPVAGVWGAAPRPGEEPPGMRECRGRTIRNSSLRLAHFLGFTAGIAAALQRLSLRHSN